MIARDIVKIFHFEVFLKNFLKIADFWEILARSPKNVASHRIASGCYCDLTRGKFLNFLLIRCQNFKYKHRKALKEGYLDPLFILSMFYLNINNLIRCLVKILINKIANFLILKHEKLLFKNQIITRSIFWMIKIISMLIIWFK